MKKILFSFAVIVFSLSGATKAQVYNSAEATKKITGTECVAYEKGRDLPVYIKLKQGSEINFSTWEQWAYKIFKLGPEMGFELTSVQNDKNGEIHYRYVQTYNDIEIFSSALIVHTKNGKVFSVNGKVISTIIASNSQQLQESEALSSALKYIGAEKYKWEIAEEEAFLKISTKDPTATYFPKGEFFYFNDKSFDTPTYKLAYRFDIYSGIPLKRSYIFVDAQNGEILLDLNRIQNTDVPGTAITKYSGTVSITTDSVAAGNYRLRETSRGNGIETYNMQTGTNTNSAVDFTDTDNLWNNVNTAMDEIATDAHWGAEMTYDYFFNSFGRNSIDGNGFKLISYVHYDVAYDNAFWDGTSMTYGDGNGTSYTPFTALDICGHEITHGLDEKTANLTYQDESGALNEGFSDIFGTCIEKYAKPSTANWTMGENIGQIIRSLSNPKSYMCPNTYQGNFWYNGVDDNGGVHTNCGVLDYWFYLLANGGFGTNDNSIAYNITGIGMDKAAQIAYRTLTVYLTNSSNYADTRYYSIISAIDLYGPCTIEVETVANAWYACGVGGAYDSTVVADFIPSFSTFCAYPADVHFTNTSSNSNVFAWDFGDGTTSTDQNPDHTYNTYGHFDVTLISTGGSCGSDTIVKTAIISIDTLNPCSTTLPQSGSAPTQSACQGILFDSGGMDNYQDATNSKIIIQPSGAATITLTFSEFGFEDGFDFLKIYDGNSTLSPLIGSYTGNTLPNGGTITSSYGAVTIVQTSDVGMTDIGFICQWQCNYPTEKPISGFKANDTISCSGDVQFSDLTTNGPVYWRWDFGDGDTSLLQNPQHFYVLDGTYNVQLITSNSFGFDTLTKALYVKVDRPITPVTTSAWRCDAGSLTLTASGDTLLNWFDTAGNLVFVGDTFVTPNLGQSTTYYVQDITPTAANYVGPQNNAIGAGSYSTSSSQRYMIFDCYAPIKLVSVLVYSDSSFVRTIKLSNSIGTVLEDTAVLIPAGQSRINLNFDVAVGTGYRLGLTGSSHLYRNQDGATFPYTLPGVASITGSSSTFSTTAYYYFYDWEIKGGQCSSSKVPVNANIHIPVDIITPSGNIEVCNGSTVALTSINADSYLWSPGGETTQSINVGNAGTYTVVVNDSICSSSDTTEVIVVNNAPDAAFSSSSTLLTVAFTNQSTGGNTFQWSFGDGSNSQLTSPSHTYAAPGTYTVVLIAENVCGADTFTTTVTVTGSGIAEIIEDQQISIYPNPSEGVFNIDFSDLTENDILTYSVYDMLGNLVKSGDFNHSQKSNTSILDLSGTSKGLYFLNIKNSTFNKSFKIIVQ